MKNIYFPTVKNNLSPTSPKPGLIIPFSSVSASTPPTQSSTPCGQISEAFCKPAWLARTETAIIRGTPQSRRVSIAAQTVEPVAMMGSMTMARSGTRGGCCSIPQGRGWFSRGTFLGGGLVRALGGGIGGRRPWRGRSGGWGRGRLWRGRWILFCIRSLGVKCPVHHRDA
jgi:hypothetical protein